MPTAQCKEYASFAINNHANHSIKNHANSFTLLCVELDNNHANILAIHLLGGNAMRQYNDDTLMQ